MGKRFSLAAQLPEYLEFEARDGTLYPVNRVQHLSTVDQQTILRLQRQISAAVTKQKANPNDTGAANALLQALAEAIEVIAPAIPQVIRNKMNPEEQMQMLIWWKDEHPKLNPPMAPPNQNQHRQHRNRRRHPSSRG
ncbi:MAG: hypothetical protein LCH85_22220 [Chloroflexi bacterium]|nr:hypothetical protein [Chloroflexota bacterium]